MLGKGVPTLILVIIVFGLLGVTAHAFPPGVGKISFSSNRDGQLSIYLMDTDGANVTRLTIPTAGGDSDPAFSPDGHKIAFSSGREASVAGVQIFVMNADGSNVVWLRSRGASGDPSFSPDGSKIVFSSNLGGFPYIDQQIYMMNADGSNVTKLTSLQGICDAPKFSPNGRKIVFDFARFTDKPWFAELERRQIYIMDADGSNVRPLTNLPGMNGGPVFRPDGRQIAFVSVSQGRVSIYAMTPDGSHITPLTSHPTFRSGFQDEGGPTYSPDGRKIAFSSDRERFGFQIYLMGADGSSVVRLTEPTGQSWHPAFSR